MTWGLRRDGHGLGGFLHPPGHPGLSWVIVEHDGRRREPDDFYSIEAALDIDMPVPTGTRRQALALLNNATLVRSEAWERNVYGYFANCYSPDGVDRDVSKCVIPAEGAELPPPERHLAYLLVRRYFGPEVEPRLDLIANRSLTMYGTRPCTRCGTVCQYEARIDGWAPFQGDPKCPTGEKHDVPLTTVPVVMAPG